MLDGQIHPNYADVAATLVRQIPKDNRGGAAVCVYHRGHPVVDIWGGARNRQGEPWLAETTASTFSTGKGVLSTLAHILVDQGRAGYDDTVAKHWPEFGTRGKDRITLRDVLCHEAGLYRLSEMIDQPELMLDWEYMKSAVADAEPVHPPGRQHGYHALTYGWLLGGFIEAVAGQDLEVVLQEQLVEPLQLDGMFMGMPTDALYRRAMLRNGVTQPPQANHAWQSTLMSWAQRGFAAAGVDFNEFRAALMPFDEPVDWNDEAIVQAKIPAANSQFTARSLARMYAMIAAGGELDGKRLLSQDAVAAFSQVQNTTRDKVLFIPMKWRLGYHRAFTLGVKAPHAFGHYGYGGSGAFCDPSRQLAVALVVNSGSGSPAGDARVPWIARAAMRAVDRLKG